ncbi:DUF4386 domain-containing protein [Nonomuraea mangrovi]|uniref:DUF4386 domain-containing protein n=2 Tax=Nonomuraea TaxID=83681 RepID=A0ABW4SWD9_9ACTN
MQTRTTARVVGTLFVIATAAGVLSVALLGPSDHISAPHEFAKIHHQVAAGALMVLVMAAAIAMIPPILYPVLKEHNEALALGYVVARGIEAVLVLPAAIGPLLLLSMASPQPQGAPNDPERFDYVRELAQTYDTWGYSASVVFFCLSVLLLNYLLYRSRVVPRLISGWALAAVPPYLAGGLLVMFGLLTTSSAVNTLLILPLAVNEMVLALWLLVKGIKPATVRV